MLVAVQVTDDGQPERVKLSVVDGFSKDAVEQWAGQNLEPGSVVHTDGLGCFRGVEAAGCEHRPRVTGGGKAGCELPGLRWVNTILGNVKRSLDGTYHHFEAHYAARYLAEFQYRFNRRYDLAAMLPRLLQAAATALPLPRPILLSTVAWPDLAAQDGAAPALRAQRRIVEAPCRQRPPRKEPGRESCHQPTQRL